MVFTNIKDFKRYVSLHPRFAKVAEALETMNFLNLELGRIDLDGDNLFVNNVAPHCVKLEDQPLEMHRDYIDIQVLLEGKESMGFKALSEVKEFSMEYDAEKDCALTNEQGTTLVNLLPGDICIFYPEDAHAPLIGEGQIRKLIFKVKL